MMLPKRRLGRTGLMVSEIGLGGSWLRGKDRQQPTEHTRALVHRSLELGINYIDTSECYIDLNRGSEIALGKALATWDGRPYYLATKFGHVPRYRFDYSADSVVQSVEESLRALQKSKLDLIQLHTGPEPTREMMLGPNGVIAGMQRARDKGLVQYLGVTGLNAFFLAESVATGAFDTVLIHRHFDATVQTADAIFEQAKKHDTGVVIGGPVSGILSMVEEGKTDQSTEPIRQRLRALEEIAAELEITLIELGLRFVLSSPDIACCLSGPAAVDEIESTLTYASRGPLPAEVVRRIMAV